MQKALGYIILLFLVLVTTICSAQYENWTFVRPLPQSEIAEFIPLSKNEIIALSNGIIYYTEDLGSNWTLLIESDGDTINSMKSDKGNIYYTNNEGLHKTSIGGTSEMITHGVGSYRLNTVKGDTIILNSDTRLHYTLDGGESWRNSGGYTIYDSTNFHLRGDYLFFLHLHFVVRYSISQNDFTSISPFGIESRDGQYAVSSSDLHILSYKSGNTSDLFHHHSTNHGIDYNLINQYSDSVLKIFKGLSRDIILLSVESSPIVLSLSYSKDNGQNFETIDVAPLTEMDPPSKFIFNDNCPYLFILTESGRLYRTTNPISTTKQTNSIEFNLTPNPSTNLISINFPTEGVTYDVSVYDPKGILVLTEKNVRSGQDINISQLKQGTYFLQVLSSNGKVNLRKFVKIN